MRKETVEEYFLDNIKNVLQFGNDVQAIRFMEKYFEAKQERSYSEEEVHDIIDNYFEWRFCGNHNIGYDEWFEQFKKK